MKKLMVALTAIAVSMFTQAAQFSWSAEGVSGYNGASQEDYLIYWVDAATTVTADNYSNIASFGHADTWGGVDDVGEAEGIVSGFSAGDTVSGYLVVFDSDDISTAEHFYTSATQSTTANASGIFVPASLTYDMSGSASASAWTATSGGGSGSGGETIPEPTSGLLLLVGGAMLALRRKQK